MNSLALFGEFSGSRGSFLPWVPIPRRHTTAAAGTSGRRARCRHSRSIAAERRAGLEPLNPAGYRRAGAAGARAEVQPRSVSLIRLQRDRRRRVPRSVRLKVQTGEHVLRSGVRPGLRAVRRSHRLMVRRTLGVNFKLQPKKSGGIYRAASGAFQNKTRSFRLHTSKQGVYPGVKYRKVKKLQYNLKSRIHVHLFHVVSFCV